MKAGHVASRLHSGAGGRASPRWQAHQGPAGRVPRPEADRRTFINTWEDARVVDTVKKTGCKKLIMAALWSEICLAMPTIQAAGEGYDVFAVTDASGGVTREAHDMAVQRMILAGVVPITWMAVAGELQRDWAREAGRKVRRHPRLARRRQRHRLCLGTAAHHQKSCAA
jgi:nicotinamidase-related amidase